MTELERFAALLLNQWQSGGGQDGGPIMVGNLLDNILPYRVARRYLPLEVSEDYELLVLKLVAGEGGLVITSPAEAGEMARSTLAESLPDLDVLQLLRSATVMLTEDSLYRLEGVRPLPSGVAGGGPSEVPSSDEAADNEGVFPIRPAAAMPVSGPRDETPPPHLEQVEFTPPGETCWSCGIGLPRGRRVSFCVQCGADQRVPTCSNCGTEVERSWRFCADCGTAL